MTKVRRRLPTITARRISKVMADLGWANNKLAKKADVSPTTIARYIDPLRGEIPYEEPTLRKIANALGCSYYWILGKGVLDQEEPNSGRVNDTDEATMGDAQQKSTATNEDRKAALCALVKQGFDETKAKVLLGIAKECPHCDGRGFTEVSV